MGTTPSDEAVQGVRQLSAEEREELRCVAFFLARLAEMRDRGLITEMAYATVATETEAWRRSIETAGRARGEIAEARRLAVRDPNAAIAQAKKARGTDSSNQEAWTLELDLHRKLRHETEALALCARPWSASQALPSDRTTCAGSLKPEAKRPPSSPSKPPARPFSGATTHR